jgi:hypothetical protein
MRPSPILSDTISDAIRYWEPRRIVYCGAYLGDVFVQISGLRVVWQRWRWVLFVIGTTFAAVITRWVAIAFFAT